MKEKDSVLLQLWGTEYRRANYGHDYFVKKLDECIKRTKIIGKTIILIPDTRFQNEYEYIKKQNGYYVEVVRLDKYGTRFIANDRDANHISEIGLDNVEPDFTLIAEDGNLESLYLQSEKAIETILQNEIE